MSTDDIQLRSAATVKVFISSLCASKEAKLQQQRIIQALEAKNVTFDKKDIATDPAAKREFRMLMRGYIQHNAVAAPPQIFNGDFLCGDFEAFYWAVEEERLLEFLRLAPPSKKTVPLPVIEHSLTSDANPLSTVSPPTSATCNLSEQGIDKTSEEFAPVSSSDPPPVAPLLPPPLQAPPAPPPPPLPAQLIAVPTTNSNPETTNCATTD